MEAPMDSPAAALEPKVEAQAPVIPPQPIPLGEGEQQALNAILARAGLAPDGAPEPEEEEDIEDMDEESDSEEISRPAKVQDYKCKPRRKATQKPVGSDQKRQAFSKRKRGIVLKAYQLHKLTDAKVFMFVVNDKGSSWSYSSPGFASALQPGHLRHMRELAGLPHTAKHVTEVMAHPKMDEQDRMMDDRHLYLNGYDGPPGPTTRFRSTGAQPRGSGSAPPQPPPLPAPPAPPPALPPYTGPIMPAPPIKPQGMGGPHGVLVQPPPAISLHSTQAPPKPLAPPLQSVPPPILHVSAPAQQQAPRAPGPQGTGGRQLPAKFQFAPLQLEQQDEPQAEPAAGTGETIITPSGQKLAAAVGINLANLVGAAPPRDMPEMSGTHLTSGSGTSEQAAQTLPSQGMAGMSGGTSSFAMTGTGQMITDAAGNIYRIVGPPQMMPTQVQQHVHHMQQPHAHHSMGSAPTYAQATPAQESYSPVNGLAALAAAAAQAHVQQQGGRPGVPVDLGASDANYTTMYHHGGQVLQGYVNGHPQYAATQYAAYSQPQHLVIMPQNMGHEEWAQHPHTG